jgi:hypothetical protein
VTFGFVDRITGIRGVREGTRIPLLWGFVLDLMPSRTRERPLGCVPGVYPSPSRGRAPSLMSSVVDAIRKSAPYPSSQFYPTRAHAPGWAPDIVEAFTDAAPQIDSRINHGVTSDAAPAVLRAALVVLGFQIEASKAASGKIRRPLLFGENGSARVAYEVDGVHPELNIVLEIEAGRAAAGHADS